MTQEQALAAFQELRPKSRHLAVSRDRHIGYRPANDYYLWDHSQGPSALVASSDRSWEHALAIAKSGDEDCWPAEDAVFEDEVTR
jgi:hypothetical protein